MKVESRVRVIAAAAVAGSAGAASRSSAPTLSVQARRVSGSIPASIGRRCSSTPAAIRYGIQAEKDLIEFGRRAAMRRPIVPSFRPAAAGAAEAGQPERDLTEQSGDLVR